MYYNGSGVLNSGCAVNFSIGNRSTGKSYYWKRYCIKRYLQHGEQFLYLRRNDADLDIAMPEWFDDIGHEFHGMGIEVKKGHIYIGKWDEDTGKLIEKKCCGYCHSMSRAGKLKSIPLERVNTIFYDEFIPEDGRYLKPSNPYYEPEMLLSIYMTVARGYGKVIRDDVRLIACANMITMYNPYFSMFGIDLTRKKRVKVNGVYAEKVTNKAVANEIRNSKIGKVLESTGYGKYVLDNESLVDDYSHLLKPPKESRLMMQVYIHRWYQLYCEKEYGNNLYWVEGYDPYYRAETYKAVEIPGSDEIIPWFKGNALKFCQDMYKLDTIYYDSMRTKMAVSGIIGCAPRR